MHTFSLFFFTSCFLSGYLISIETIPGYIVVIRRPDSPLSREICNAAPLICSHLTSLHYPRSRGGTIPAGAALHFHLDCFWLSYLTCFFSSSKSRDRHSWCCTLSPKEHCRKTAFTATVWKISHREPLEILQGHFWVLEQRGLEARQGTWSWAVSPGAASSGLGLDGFGEWSV